MNVGVKMIHLDTHVLAWLYFGQIQEFSKKAKELINKNELYYSPIVKLELAYLEEVGKFSVSPKQIIKTLEKDLEIKESQMSFSSVTTKALKESWTRDPFDRLIVAQAKSEKAKLLSRDRLILKHYKAAAW